jgi:prepilin-type processing-associated H-X9-DG protein
VLSVIFLLGSLLLPAVQMAREAGRRSQCSNNLRQIGIAVHAYEAIHKRFPSYCPSDYSLVTSILPHLEHEALYGLIDYNIDCLLLLPNQIAPEVLDSSPSVFECPSDGSTSAVPPVEIGAAANYRVNLGPSRQPNVEGPFETIFVHSGSAQVTDGLSNTAAFSESLVGNGTYQLRRGIWKLLYDLPFTDWELQDELCLTQRYLPDINNPTLPTGDLWGRGRPWYSGMIYSTAYTHRLPPNSPTCASHTLSATSNHPGGVNMLFADGHVAFLPNEITASVWRAIATRNGGESDSP